MKIGITTYWRGTSNYGQIVQHWALQRILEKMGHQPYLIRFYPGFNHGILKKWLKEYKVVDYVRAFLALLKGNNKVIKRELHDKERAFEKFRKEYLRVSTRKYYRIADLQACPPCADAYITGSDQVWSQLLSNRENEVYYLNFGSQDTLRIAYAPSFSMEEYPKDLHSNLHNNLARFDNVSCREYSGVKICKKAGYSNAKKVLDPTFLVKKDDYLELIKQVDNKSGKKYVFIYSLNISSPKEIRWDELKQVQKEKQIIVTPSDGYFTGDELFGTEVEYSYGTIQEWLAKIYYSSLVVTPSFHGVALAIILEKDFIYTPLKGVCAKGNNRIFDLLTDLDLTDRILSEERRYEEIINCPINWQRVNEKLNVLRNDSLAFLTNSLKK